MPLLPKYFSRTSKKNGEISVYKNFLGPWQVSVGDCGQTTRYTHAMWEDAFTQLHRARSSRRIRRILMLGLGAGGQIGTLHTRFPNCDITVVEYDEEMVSLARELELYKPFSFPNVVLSDAKDAVPRMDEKFDLVIVDLFSGPEPSPLSKDEWFIEALRERLEAQGLLVINIYKRAEYLDTAERLFNSSTRWKFRLNHLGAFWD